MSCISGLQIKLLWERLVLVPTKAANHSHSLTHIPAQPKQGHKGNTANTLFLLLEAQCKMNFGLLDVFPII